MIRGIFVKKTLTSQGLTWIMENYFYAIPAAISLFWIVRIFLLRNVNKAQLLTCAGMFAALISLFFRQSAAFMFPFFFLAVRQKVAENGITKWDPLIFLPSLAILPFHHSMPFDIFMVVDAAAIATWSVFSVSRYGKKLAELYDESDVSADDIWQVVIFIILSAVVTAIVSMLPEDVTSIPVILIILVMFISVLQFYLGYYTFRLKDTTASTQMESLPDENFGDEHQPKAQQSVPGRDEKLLQKVIDEKLYLDPSLSLVSLAEKLHTNRTYLSASIHECKGQNFSDFINTLRIAHFTEIIKSGDDTGIKDAAFNSGYNNLQSFYRHFTEIMQMTPKAWISHNKK